MSFLRVGLISPYVGSNLGDAAILEGARNLVQALIPESSFTLIVLAPSRVSGIHHLDAVPLTAATLPFFANDPAAPALPAEKGIPLHSDEALTKKRDSLKRVASFIPGLIPVVRHIRDKARALVREERHYRLAQTTIQSLDVLIVAGGGQFDDEFGGPWGHPYAMLKWVSLAHRARLPVFFIGVGVCEMRHRTTSLFIRRALAQANRISLRDRQSMTLLKRIGVRQDLFLCPDLAFGLPVEGCPSMKASQTGESRPLIGLSPIAYGRAGSWPTVAQKQFERYWKEFCDFSGLLLANNFRLKLFATDSPDFELIHQLYSRLKTLPLDPDRVTLIPSSNVFELMNHLKECNIVVASRLHGTILSHIATVPVLAISYHRKVRTYMDETGQGSSCLDFGTFTASQAFETLHSLINNSGRISQELQLRRENNQRLLQQEFSLVASSSKPETLRPERIR